MTNNHMTVTMTNMTNNMTATLTTATAIVIPCVVYTRFHALVFNEWFPITRRRTQTCFALSVHVLISSQSVRRVATLTCLMIMLMVMIIHVNIS
jgi:hypothetical protein